MFQTQHFPVHVEQKENYIFLNYDITAGPPPPCFLSSRARLTFLHSSISRILRRFAMEEAWPITGSQSSGSHVFSRSLRVVVSNPLFGFKVSSGREGFSELTWRLVRSSPSSLACCSKSPFTPVRVMKKSSWGEVLLTRG